MNISPAKMYVQSKLSPRTLSHQRLVSLEPEIVISWFTFQLL